jgi:hypothetical protein
MRVVFIFVVLLVLLALAAPATFAVNVWLDGRAVIARAEQNDDLRAPPSRPLSVAERTIAMNEFRETWRSRALPCRTLWNLWNDVTSDSAPLGVPVSHKVATALLDERRATSIRWQIRRIVVSCQLEQQFDDRQLLRLWLDDVSFGRPDALGIESASRAIFGKPSRSLNRNESARLAALIRAPSLRGQLERWTERAAEIEARVAPR